MITFLDMTKLQKELMEKYDMLLKKHNSEFKSSIPNESKYRTSADQLKLAWVELKDNGIDVPEWI